eukprot:gene32339-41902_t
MSEDLAKSSDFFLAEGKNQDDRSNSSSHCSEDHSSDELKSESLQIEAKTPNSESPIFSNDIVPVLENAEENHPQDNIEIIDSNFDYDTPFRSHSYDEAKSFQKENLQPVINPFISYGKREITSPVINPFCNNSAVQENDRGMQNNDSNSDDGTHFDYDATFPSFDESKNSIKGLDDIIPPVVNPFIAFGKREITTPVANPFNPSNNVSPSVATVFYTVNEYNNVNADDASTATLSHDVFSVCPPDSPDSPIASPTGSNIHSDEVPDEAFIAHYYGSDKPNDPSSVDSAWAEDFEMDGNDFDFDDIINNVSANLGNNFNRSSFSAINSPAFIPEPVASIPYEESLPKESECSNIDNSTRGQSKTAPQTGPCGSVKVAPASKVESTSKKPVTKAPQSAPKVASQNLSAKKLNLLLTEMQVRLNVPPSEELSAMVSNFTAVASDPKLAVGRSANRLSSKNVDLHNEIISHEDVASTPTSPSATVEPTTELKEIKKGGKITKPNGYPLPSQRRDSDAASVSSNRSVKTRSSIGTVASKQSALSHSSKTTATSRLSVKTPHSGPSRIESSSVKAAVKSSHALAQAKKTASPGSGYGQFSSSPVPAASRNRATLSPASFTSPAAPCPRSKPQSPGGTISKAFSPVPSSTPKAISADKKSPASDFSLKRSKSSDGLLRGSSAKETVGGSAKSPVVLSTTKVLDGKFDAKSVRSPTVTPTATIQRAKSLDKTQTIRRNNSSDSTSTCHSAPATKAAAPKRAPYTGTLYDTKPKRTTPLAEVVTIGAITRSAPSLKSSSYDSKHSLRDSKKSGASGLTARILAADDLQRARSCERSSSPRKGSLTAEKVEAQSDAAVAAVASTPMEDLTASLSVITAEESIVLQQDEKRAKDIPDFLIDSYEAANPMLKGPPKVAARERSDSRDSIVSSASSQATSFLSIYSPASGSNLLQVKRTKAPPVIRSVSASASTNTQTHRRDTSLDHSAIGEEYHLRAMNEAAAAAAAASTSSSSRSSMRRSSTSSSTSSSSSDAMVFSPPPPRPRPEAAVLVSPLPKKVAADMPQYMPPLTQASHEMITKMFKSIDASSKGSKSATGTESCSSENESSHTNMNALDIRPSGENAFLHML